MRKGAVGESELEKLLGLGQAARREGCGGQPGGAKAFPRCIGLRLRDELVRGIFAYGEQLPC